MIFVDFSSTFYISLYSLENKAKVKLTEDNLKVSLFQSLWWKNRDFSEKYGQLIVCCDSPNNWRKEVLKEYKANRAKKRSQDTEHDWPQIYKWLENIKEDFRNNSSFVMLEIDGLEGDDLMALGSRLINKGKHVLLTEDKDMTQCISSNTRVYSPMKQDFKEKDDSLLKELILSGDTSDGVPNIFSPNDHYVKEDKVRAKPVTAKIKENCDPLSEEGIRHYFKEEENLEDIVKNWKRNRELVDLSFIPNKYEKIFREEFVKSYNIAKQHDSNRYALDLGINME